jgi:hypothetical protein
MPAHPKLFQLVGIAAIGPRALDGRNIEACVRLGAIFPLSVVAFQRGSNFGELTPQLGIFRCRRSQREPPQLEFARQIRGHLQALEALGLVIDQIEVTAVSSSLASAASTSVSCVMKFAWHPVRTANSDAAVGQPTFRTVHERLGIR